ncbi:MAG: hypothetical protein AAF773_28585, partial [Cyanobacteria bacterium P01_D01_bin.115]
MAKYRQQAESIAPVELGTPQLFEQFIDYRRKDGTSGQRIAAVYKPMLSNLKRFGRCIEDEAAAREFVDMLRSRQSPRVANQNLTLLCAFGRWCVEQELLSINPYAAIKPLKCSRSVQNRQPFTRDEIERFLTTL